MAHSCVIMYDQPMAFFDRRAVVRVGTQNFADLRVTFDVRLSLARSENTAVVTLYNLSVDNRAALAAAEQIPVLVLAGYRDAAPVTIFSGVLSKVETIRERADVGLELSSGDGTPRFIAPRSHAPDADLGAIFGQLLDDLVTAGLGLGNARTIQARLRGRSLGRSPTVVSGRPADALDQLLIPAGLEWSVQSGQLQILERGATTTETAPLISPRSGLRGRPERGEKKRITIDIGIVGGVAPGRRLVLQSDEINGTVRVESVQWIGDTRGGDWRGSIEGQLVS